MSKTKTVKVTKKLLDKEIKKGSLFVLEEYLDCLPVDWIDCVTFISNNGMKNRNEMPHVLIIDDDQSQKFFDLIAKENIKLFVFSEAKRMVLEVMLTKEKNKDTNEYERHFIGGENIRKFCDDKNIYYRSALTSDGKLLSGTNMLYQKNTGEDCRVPVMNVG